MCPGIQKHDFIISLSILGAAFHLFSIYLLHICLMSGTVLDSKENIKQAVVPAQGAYR